MKVEKTEKTVYNIGGDEVTYVATKGSVDIYRAGGHCYYVCEHSGVVLFAIGYDKIDEELLIS